ncbi:MAG: hypothetical protein KBE91_04420 [Bacteroidia bacterium]|nr:hypothetical protein [Bacteroidia bacterium]
MKNNNNFTLIDGVFTPQEAREVLLNIFNSKIRFHKAKIFSFRERNGIEDEASNTRVLQLKNTMEKLELFINQCEQDGEKLTVKSEIAITLNSLA